MKCDGQLKVNPDSEKKELFGSFSGGQLFSMVNGGG
jgi:hypothetical protein